ncbi:RRP15-like protein [Styela clava]|uniref:RRP15-like protein n=1 Tax=Styela clava TaxID=7725 RepID=UPI00193A5091|nr:RRP15-like protein [Styela clava]
MKMLQDKLDDSQVSGGDSSSENEEKSNNAAWAEVMGKVLNKQGPKNEKSIILAKNKEKVEENKQERSEQRERKKQLNKKRKWEEMNHVKPNALEKDYERNLQKIATRGVVQLFNAVKKHQKQLDEKLKSAKTEGKKEQVMKSVSKGEFLDMLKDDKVITKQKAGKNFDPGMPDTTAEDKGWDVLRDDFMMGNKLKDWDQRSDGEDD